MAVRFKLDFLFFFINYNYKYGQMTKFNYSLYEFRILFMFHLIMHCYHTFYIML